jgi:hypothetical protein
MIPLSLRPMKDARVGRFGLALTCRALGALLAALFTLPFPGLAQEGQSFTDLIVTERLTAFLLFNRGDGTFVMEDYQLGGADGVATGDFDRDGDLDFALLSGLFLGNGDFTFMYLPFAPGDFNLCCDTDNSFEFADMDADGLTDVVLACLDTTVIYYGTGDDRILERGTVLRSGATHIENDEGASILAVGDMNEDGLPDLKAGQTSFGTQFFLNEGGRSFRPLSTELPQDHVLRNLTDIERWLDFNGDGHLDIVTIPYQGAFPGLLGIYLGNGKLEFVDKSFDYQELFDTYFVADFDIGDIDGDGASDVVILHWCISEESPSTLTFLLGRGDGTIRDVRQMRFLHTIEVPDGTGLDTLDFTDLATGDFNGDGIVDIALINRRGLSCFRCISASVLWILDGTGGGNFAEPRVYPGPTGAGRIFALGDVDRQFVRGDADDDRKLDINDAVVTLLALFSGMGVNCGQALDATDDGQIDLADAVFVLEYLFLGGPPPPAPYPEPGIETTNPFTHDPGCSPEWWEVYRQRQGG